MRLKRDSFKIIHFYYSILGSNPEYVYDIPVVAVGGIPTDIILSSRVSIFETVKLNTAKLHHYFRTVSTYHSAG